VCVTAAAGQRDLASVAARGVADVHVGPYDSVPPRRTAPARRLGPTELCPAATAKMATVPLPTTKVAFDDSMVLPEPRTGPPPRVIAVQASMFDHARELAQAPGPRRRVAIHNFANNYRPGLLRTDASGKHFFITHTQEEQLLRATMVDGHIVLPLDAYPISEGCHICGLYTRDARFANDPRTAQPLAPERHFVADIITCAAPKYPRLNEDGEYTPEARQAMLRHMVLVINMAKDADVFVTGLWGCGAFSHPISASLRLWKEAIQLAAAVPKEIHFCYFLDGLTNLQTQAEGSASIMDLVTQ